MKDAVYGMHKRLLKNFLSLQKGTGLAVSDELKLIATALGTVPTMEVMPYLKHYISENSVECFVVGEPKQMDNSPSQSARFIEPFVKQLMKAFPGTRLERMDERFTSLIASRAILESGLKKMARRDKLRGLFYIVKPEVMLMSLQAAPLAGAA